MVIDFHVHVFPDKIAKKTVDFLQQKSGNTPSFDGSVGGFLSMLNDSKVDVAVSLPVLTRPEQFDSVLEFAINVNKRFENCDKKIISFAGIHPKSQDVKNQLLRVKNAGIKGVKIHPDYQDTFIDDDGYFEILSIAKELDLIVVTHAGVDSGYRNEEVKCPPNRLKKLIEKVNHKKFVLAHMGGSELPGEVLKEIAGMDVYFDTAYVLKTLSKAEFLSLCEKHGYDKILFASDMPWSDFNADLEIVNSYVKDGENKDKILYKNAVELLGL